MKHKQPLKIYFLKGASFISDLLPGRSENKGSIRVLFYHNITDLPVLREWHQMTTPRSLFEKHACYLAENGYRTITADEVCGLLASDKDIPKKHVCLTFDDGYRDNYDNAFPILEKYKFKATIFLSAGFVGKRDGAQKYMTWREIAEMAECGRFEFGCHSLSHKNLASLDGNSLKKEIEDAKKIIEDNTGKSVSTFAYPFGWQNSFDNRVIDAVMRAGFSCAFTAIHGANTKKTHLFKLRRIRISWLNEIGEFRKALRGSYDWYSIYQTGFSLCKKIL
ncbi:MAG: polysaccharide deacetylase family protein [Candidatus Omnitrophica bacterium]|nr:polysaccharide deacetylase family protein [Candidatus Omnitrophota bacterium]